MNILKRSITILVCVIFILSCKGDKKSNDVLPSGCCSNGVFGLRIINSDVHCLPTNGFTNAENALGAPDAGATGEGKLQFRGFVSLGINGNVTIFTSRLCILEIDRV